MKLLLWPFALIYIVLVRVRLWLYKVGFLKSYKVSVPVISVGNITAGGTGKTPAIDFLIGWAKSNNLKVGVVSRGYKGSYKGVKKVENDLNDGAAVFGDEPFMLANRHKDISVYVGRDRVSACEELISKENPDLILADDGFQHLRLKRDLDFVILDGMQNPVDYWPLPVGLGREPLSSLSRAQVLLFNKLNLAPKSNVITMMKTIEHLLKNSGDGQLPVKLEGNYRVESIIKASGGGEKLEGIPEPCVLVSGIGRPESFEKLMKSKGVTIQKHFIFPDHHEYSHEDISAIVDEIDKLGVEKILTTEKDAVKLRPFIRLQKQLWVVKLQLEILGETEKFYETLSRIVRPNSC